MPLKTLRKETSRHLYKLKFLEVPLDWLFLIYYDRVNKSHRFVSFNCNHSHMKERKVSSYHFKLGKISYYIHLQQNHISKLSSVLIHN